MVSRAKEILTSCPDITIDYVSICDITTLDEVSLIKDKEPVLMAIAVMLGKTRLIDNMVMAPGSLQIT